MADNYDHQLESHFQTLVGKNAYTLLCLIRRGWQGSRLRHLQLRRRPVMQALGLGNNNYRMLRACYATLEAFNLVEWHTDGTGDTVTYLATPECTPALRATAKQTITQLDDKDFYSGFKAGALKRIDNWHPVNLDDLFANILFVNNVAQEVVATEPESADPDDDLHDWLPDLMTEDDVEPDDYEIVRRKPRSLLLSAYWLMVLLKKRPDSVFAYTLTILRKGKTTNSTFEKLARWWLAAAKAQQAALIAHIDGEIDAPPDGITQRMAREAKRIYKRMGSLQFIALRDWPDPSPRSKRKPRSTADPRHRPLMDAYQTALGYPIPNGGQEGKAAKNLLRQYPDVTVTQIIDCYHALKADSFWRKQHLSLTTIHKQFGAWVEANGHAGDIADWQSTEEF